MFSRAFNISSLCGIAPPFKQVNKPRREVVSQRSPRTRARAFRAREPAKQTATMTTPWIVQTAGRAANGSACLSSCMSRGRCASRRGLASAGKGGCSCLHLPILVALCYGSGCNCLQEFTPRKSVLRAILTLPACVFSRRSGVLLVHTSMCVPPMRDAIKFDFLESLLLEPAGVLSAVAAAPALPQSFIPDAHVSSLELVHTVLSFHTQTDS